MLCRADSIGVFQVESRAQMATLPRLRPRTFYDLVVEVALIRPGPIQGGSVHPYIRRRNGQEPVTYLHPLLETLAGARRWACRCSRSSSCRWPSTWPASPPARPTSCARPWAPSAAASAWSGCASASTTAWPSAASPATSPSEIFDKMAAFANYGFPESHSVSFAYLVYASAWIKLHEPAAFCAALLNAQPMGFYSPHSLVQDARRHGVVVRTPDLNALRGQGHPRAVPGVHRRAWPCASGLGLRARPSATTWPTAHRRGPALHATSRTSCAGCPRVGLPAPGGDGHGGGASAASAWSGAEALWAVGAVAQSRPGPAGRRGHRGRGADAAGHVRPEEAVADLWATGVSPDGHPTRFCAPRLDRLGVRHRRPAAAGATDGARVVVGGVVTHRQRPATAQGTTFINLEDETGLINVVGKGLIRWRFTAQSAASSTPRAPTTARSAVRFSVAPRAATSPRR